MIFSMTGQEKCDCLIEMTAKADLTVYVRFILADYENVTVSFLSLS